MFNRPDLAKQVLQRIAAQRPRHILLACDGPRPDHPADEAAVSACRDLVRQIDWPCSISSFFSERNRGCRHQMAAALTWAFDQHERVIVLEDDCLPHPEFFSFCESLLDRYQADPRVMMISGDNFQDASPTGIDPQKPKATSTDSYYFSSYTHIWGWASWRRAWQQFDLPMHNWSRDSGSATVAKYAADREELNYWVSTFDRQARGEIDTWDFSWQWACWNKSGLVVLPHHNLVTNIGFAADATHTCDPEHWLANRPTRSLGPLRHPTRIARNVEADLRTWQTVFRPSVEPVTDGPPSASHRWHRFINKLLPKTRLPLRRSA